MFDSGAHPDHLRFRTAGTAPCASTTRSQGGTTNVAADRIGYLGVPPDQEGFIARTCPWCRGGFKLRVADWSDSAWPACICPCCGLSAPDQEFTPRDVRAAVRVVAENYLIEQINTRFGRLARSLPRTGAVRVEHRPIPQRRVPLLRAVTDLAHVRLCCCDREMKLPFAEASTIFFCPFCGQTHT